MSDSVRIDSWLWAARFFKTRSLAKQALEGGKIRIDGSRAKASKPVRPGTMLEIHKGDQKWTVTVKGVASKRGPARDAQALYCETAESVAAREEAAERKRFARLATPLPDHRPSKRERRALQRFRDHQK